MRLFIRLARAWQLAIRAMIGAAGYLSPKDLPIGEAVRWTSEIDRIDTH